MRPMRDDERQCPTCEGTGINPQTRDSVCPRCNGEKRVPRNIKLG